MTKKLLHQEWAMDLDAAIEAEAEAQAICMQTAGLPARLRRVRRESQAGLRRQLTRNPGVNRAHLDWPFFDAPHRALAAGLARLGARRRCRGPSTPTSTPTAARLVRRSGTAGWLRYCVPAAHGGALPALDSRVAVRRARDARVPRRSRRFRVRDAGPRQRRDHARRHRRRRRRAGCRRSRAATRSPRSRCRSPTPAPTSRR